jgi:hypothetical protein
VNARSKNVKKTSFLRFTDFVILRFSVFAFFELFEITEIFGRLHSHLRHGLF